jgi:hypothetical protein
MKKIIIFLFIAVIFSNNSSAGFFGDAFKVIFGESKKPSVRDHSRANNIRCKVEYTQLDLATGLEKTVKHTEQYEKINIAEDSSILYLTAQDLTDKINIWLNESENNVITNLTIINCKERRIHFNEFFAFFNTEVWGEYKSCPDKYNIKLIDFLDHPNQWGYNVHKERLIDGYEEGCRDYNSRFD